MIKYIGSKRLLVGSIVAAVGELGGESVLDLFSGTSRVGHALKRQGYSVASNDHNAFAHTLAACYVGADARRWTRGAERLISELDSLPGKAGWFTETFCVKSRFLQPHNGARVDAIREKIAALELDPVLEAIALTSLMEAADRVDSTTGLQMAYLKQWAPRSHGELHLRVPELLPGKGAAHRLDAVDAVSRLSADIAYIDPPYNQHSYLGNYHIWESLVLWDKPPVYGVACKREDVRLRRSAFNSRTACGAAMQRVLSGVRARNIIVSFSDEGFFTSAQLVEMLSERGRVEVLEFDLPRYVGARIGIHDPAGRKVGTVGRLRNVERLFVVRDAAATA